MYRPLRSLLDILAVLPLLAGVLLLAANTEPGRDLIVHGIAVASRGQVVLEGLGGTLPLAPRIKGLALHDPDGAWLRIQDVALDLDPWPLLRGEALGVTLVAEALTLERLPPPSEGEGAAGGLPFAVQVRHLRLARLGLDGVVPGAPPLTLEGDGLAATLADLAATLILTAPGRPDRYSLELGLARDRYRLDLAVQEAPGGLLAALLGPGQPSLEALGDWHLVAQAEGPATALALDATLAVGPLKASATALLDLQAQVATRFKLSAATTAGNLAPWGYPDIAWANLAVQAELCGPWTGPQVRAQVALADLAAPDLAGQVRLELIADLAGPPHLELTGELALERGPGPLLGLLGAARVALDLRQDGSAWQIANAEIAGAPARALVRGRVAADTLALAWTLDLRDLATLAPGWSGRVQAQGELAGHPTAPDLVADLTADAAYAGVGAGQLHGRLQASLAAPAGSLALTGDWAGQPVAIDLSARRDPDGALHLDLGDSRLAGVAAAGALHLPAGAAWPLGKIRLQARRLADLAPLLAPWTGPGLTGQLDADLSLDTKEARLVARGEGLGLAAAMGIGSLALEARVMDPLASPRTDATLRLRQVVAGAIGGDLAMTAKGPLTALELTTVASLSGPHGSLGLDLAGRLDGPARRLALSRLQARSKAGTLNLTAPAVLHLGEGLAVDRLRLGLGKGSIEVVGRLAPELDLNATVTRLPLAPLWFLAPDFPLAGTLDAQVRLVGPLAGPLGSIAIQGEGLRMTAGPARALAAVRASLRADLGQNGTQVDARVQLGPRSELRLRGGIAGRLPGATGALDLRADGRLDLALLDSLVGAGGRQIAGQAVLTTAIAGTLAAPRMDGSLSLADATLIDRGLGLALSAIGGTLRLTGERIHLGLRGRAGPGTIALEGEVGALAPGLPVDLRLVARDARPVQRDDLALSADAELSLRGRLPDAATLAGAIHIERLDIHLPERLPTAVAILEVRERGGGRTLPPPAPARSPPNLGLDLTLAAPRAVYVRGRGVDAELGGEVRLAGTLANPVIAGGFNLLRGQYSLVGQTIDFTRGRIGFDGATGIDPALDLEARVTAAGNTAILAVLGTATAPRIELRGEPEIPQDEVLSRLLFGVAGGRLSPLQAARLGLAAASLAGVGGGGPGLVDRVRSGLGLDRLSLGNGEGTLEGGRQFDDRIYLGARQGPRASEPQAVLRIEISPRLRLEADVGPTGGTRAGGAYEIEY